jgi:hypothetical protein
MLKTTLARDWENRQSEFFVTRKQMLPIAYKYDIVTS